MIETIVVGFSVVLVTLPILLAVVRLAEASDVAQDEARSIATWVARHGIRPELETVGDVDITVVDGVVHVSTVVEVDLVAIGGSTVTSSVSGSFAMPISQYRSDR